MSNSVPPHRWQPNRLPFPGILQARTLESVAIFYSLGFPYSSVGKESACNAGDLGLIPGLGRSPGEGKGCLLQYSGLENSIDYIVHGVTMSWTRLSDFHFTSKGNCREVGGKNWEIGIDT